MFTRDSSTALTLLSFSQTHIHMPSATTVQHQSPIVTLERSADLSNAPVFSDLEETTIPLKSEIQPMQSCCSKVLLCIFDDIYASPRACIYFLSAFQGNCRREKGDAFPWHPPFCSRCPLSPLQHYPQHANISDSSSTTLPQLPNTPPTPTLPPAELKQEKLKIVKAAGSWEKVRMREWGEKYLQIKIAETALSIRLFIEHNWGKNCHNFTRYSLEKVQHLLLTSSFWTNLCLTWRIHWKKNKIFSHYVN